MQFSIQSIYSWYRNAIRNPKYRWWIILGTLIYVLSPLDISPDLIPIVGQVDDVVLITLLITEVSQMLIDYAKNRQSQSSPSTTEDPAKTIDVEVL